MLWSHLADRSDIEFGIFWFFSQQEYNSLYAYCSGLIDNFKMDLAQGVVYAGE